MAHSFTRQVKNCRTALRGGGQGRGRGKVGRPTAYRHQTTAPEVQQFPCDCCEVSEHVEDYDERKQAVCLVSVGCGEDSHSMLPILGVLTFVRPAGLTHRMRWRRSLS